MLGIVKEALKVDGSEEDLSLTLLINAAKEYLSNAGVPAQEEGKDSALYQLAVIKYALLNYENYDKSLNVEALKLSLQTDILQMKDYGGAKSG
ncbi:head-tail connector protein [Metabacillus fastidiosus]|uniref:head-tail connector protein n=1 Tax=Metabacillus fastidiosus TaxID=1458 RepID=UPI003D2A0226